MLNNAKLFFVAHRRHATKTSTQFYTNSGRKCAI